MTHCMDARQRDETLQQIQDKEFDIIVIGGGITGAGILREAALRGLSVALVEADDFAAGTSSKSTKLIHGGIRYLAMGHFHIVRQASRERKRVHRLAPHLAEPGYLMLPARNIWEHIKYRLGIRVYEYLGQVDRADRHFNLSGQSLGAHEPLLDTNAFPYASVYREYLTEDARLVLANIRAGVDAGGIAVNYAQVTTLIRSNAGIGGVNAVCRLTGAEVQVRSRAVINAAGPWVSLINEQNGLPGPKSIVLSRGVHVVVARSRLAVKYPAMLVTEDHRPVFVIPRGAVVYIGTTDTAYPDGADYWPGVERGDVEYLFRPVRRYFGVELVLSDCLASWAGLRPLIAEPGKSTRDISRRDEIWVGPAGLITVAGGKLTGYRKMAEDTVDKALQTLGMQTAGAAEDVALPGGDFHSSVDAFTRTLAAKTGMAEGVVQRMARLYGTECEQVIALGGRPLVEQGMVLQGEIYWAVRQEGASTLIDTVYRRTRAAVYCPDEVLDLIEPVADLMAAELRWDAARRENEVKRIRERLHADVRFT